jgi:hypothetical protein
MISVVEAAKRATSVITIAGLLAAAPPQRSDNIKR